MKIKASFKRPFFILILFSLLACTGVPSDIRPVKTFDLNRYLGTWYEIARLDHSFEQGLSFVTADYSIKKDGSIKVLNKGYSAEKNTWSTAEGRAKFVGDKNIGHLKVSFFGPFYGAYVIFKLDDINYQYAFVTSYNKEFLWLLSRTPTVSDAVLADFKRVSADYGFAVQDIIYVKQ